MKQLKTFAVIGLLIILVVALVVSGIRKSQIGNTATPTISQPAATQLPATPSTIVTLFCQDCAGAGMKIYIWTHPVRSGVAGSVPNNTNAELIRTLTVDGVKYYEVNVVGMGIRGYVSDLMIKNP
jgi:hypothetical protein